MLHYRATALKWQNANGIPSGDDVAPMGSPSDRPKLQRNKRHRVLPPILIIVPVKFGVICLIPIICAEKIAQN